jgi:hypothetical protein
LLGTNPRGSLEHLNAEVEQLWNSAVQPTTLAVYNTGWQCFIRFMMLHNLTDTVRTQLPPVSEEILVWFAVHCTKTLKLSPSSIKLYLAGIRFHYLGKGHPNPLVDAYGNHYPRLQTILRSMKKLHTTPQTVRLPINAQILTNISMLLHAGIFGPYTDLLMETACTTAFFGFLRCGEFTVRQKFNPQINLCLQDITFLQDRCNLKLKASKTDPFRQGIVIPLFSRQHSICPVRNLRKYHQVRLNCGGQQLDPLFVSSDGSPLTRAYFIEYLRVILSRLGLHATQYSGHSFRVGACTSGSDARLEDHLLKTLGRWSSDCYTRYVKTSDSVLKQAQHALVP